jgi:hypothetical protein
VRGTCENKKSAHISFVICSTSYVREFLLTFFHLNIAIYFPIVAFFSLFWRMVTLFSEQFVLFLTNHSPTIPQSALFNSTSNKILRVLQHSYGSYYHTALLEFYLFQIRDLATGKSKYL